MKNSFEFWDFIEIYLNYFINTFIFEVQDLEYSLIWLNKINILNEIIIINKFYDNWIKRKNERLIIIMIIMREMIRKLLFKDIIFQIILLNSVHCFQVLFSEFSRVF